MMRYSTFRPAMLLSVLCALLLARSVAPAAETHPLVKAVEAMKADDMKEARRLIDTCTETDKKHLAYFVVNAYYYACCDSHAHAATASRTASRLDEKLLEPYAYLALSLAEAGYGKDALEAAEAGAKLAPSDDRFVYAAAFAQASLGKWKEAREGFGRLRGGSPLAAQAKAHVEEMDKCDSAIKNLEGEKQKIDAKLAELKTKTDRVRYGGKAAEDKLSALKKKYDNERDQVARDFQYHINRLRRPSDPSQQAAYSRAYQAAGEEAARRRRGIDEKYRPQVAEIQTEISRYVKELKDLMGEQRPLQDQKTKLDAQAKREQAALREKMKADVAKTMPLTPQRASELLAWKAPPEKK